MPTPRVDFLSPTKLKGFALPHTLDYPHIDNRYNNVQPPEPHNLRSGSLPPTTIDKVREEITELLRDKLGISMSSMGQSYRKPYVQ